MKERQELYCHNCDKYVQFDIDLGSNGNVSTTNSSVFLYSSWMNLAVN